LGSLESARLSVPPAFADLPVPGPMAGGCPLLLRILRLAVAVAACACFSAPVSGIRKDVGLISPMMCRSTVQGRHLISDDNGYVCPALAFDPWSHCCPITGARFSCQGCKLDSQCCNSYEYCVSCCLNPSKTKKEDVLKLKVAKPLTAGTYMSVFDFCVGRCRHGSTSVVHENAYASDFHHCFSVRQNSTGESNSVRFLGINIIVGRPGESCSLVCKARGQSCVPSRLSALNKCEILQKYMRCKSGCFRSLGPDQPAEVVDEAPTSLIQLDINILFDKPRLVLRTNIRIQEHACTCRWMSGSHVMVHINIPGGSVHVHEMGKKICLLLSSKGVVGLEIFHKFWSLPTFAIIFTLTRGSSCNTLLCWFLFLALLKGWVHEYVSQELCPPECIGERQVAFWGVILHLPDELIGEGPVIVLLYFSVQLLHPAYLDEKSSEVTSCLLPQPLLDTVPKLAVAVLPPELINGAEVLCRDELDLREEDIPPTPWRLRRSRVGEGGLSAAAGVTGVGVDELGVEVVVTEGEVFEKSLKEMLLLLLVDWREAFAMDGRRAGFRIEGRKKKGKEMMIKEWLEFCQRLVCTCCTWLVVGCIWERIQRRAVIGGFW
ncbi:hypothetical protein EJB05_52004, partial [Eragrostis curvula]